jgi:hypothetical protein
VNHCSVWGLCILHIVVRACGMRGGNNGPVHLLENASTVHRAVRHSSVP